MRIAALDLGSNSFHLAVVEARLDGSFATIVREREMLRLGDRVALTGSIGEPNSSIAIEVIARFKAIAEANHTDEVIAYGTAALREARDGARFVDRVARETGIGITLIDGVREAQLIFTAVRSSVLIDRPPALAVDLGGGSLEVMVGDQNALAYAASLRLGVGRLTAEFLTSDPPSRRECDRLEERVAKELTTVLDQIVELKPQMLIGSSGTFASIARMAAAERDGQLPDSINQLTVDRDDIESVAERIFSLDSEERGRLPGVDGRRSDLLPAGVTVLLHIMGAVGLGELTVSEWALREGMVIAAIGHHDPAELGDDPRAIRRASVLSLCRRSNWRQPHSRKVAGIACELFDATAELHELAPSDRELLEFGALLHDIGEHVSRTNHDRHSAYLIEHGELRGFDPDEILVLTALARYHQRGTPKQNAGPLRTLPVEVRERAVALIALLRLADALDATHAGVVEAVGVERGAEREVTLVVRARGDAELEFWMLERKQDLFEKVFRTSLAHRLERLGPGVYGGPEVATAGLG